MSAFLRKYGAGTGADLYIPIIKRASVDYAVSADWTPAAGDVKISKDGGAAANIGTLPTAVTMGNTAMWKFVFTDAELQAAYVSITVADSATKAVEDQFFAIETYGNASAMHAFDLDTASTAQTGDSYAIVNSGSHGNAALKTLIDTVDNFVDTEVAAILAAVDTEIASAITQLTDIQSRLPAALVSGRMDSSVGAMAANVLTAAAAAADFGAEIQALITGGAYTLSTDANGRVRIVDGTAAGELDTSSGTVTVGDFTTAAKALLQTEAEDALVTHRLDELLNADSDIDGAAPPTVGSVFHELMSKTAGSFTFDQTTDSLEALRDRGDSAWTTATGFSTLDAAGVRSAVGLGSANLDTQFSNVPAAVWDLADAIETSITPRKAMRAIAAKAAGLISGAGTGTEVIKGIGQSSGGTTRLTATVDSSGNISAWTLNL